MKTIPELNQNRFGDLKRAQAASGNTLAPEQRKDSSQSLDKIIELDTPIAEDFFTVNSDYQTGEPELGKNNDIIGARRTNYISNQILSRLF